jgi:hypothetical protein
MRIRQGWSGEVEPGRWAKFDIELEEEDVFRILRKAGAGADDGARLTTGLVYQLLEAEAERLMYVKLTQRYGYPKAQSAAKIEKLEEQKQRLLDDFFRA